MDTETLHQDAPGADDPAKLLVGCAWFDAVFYAREAGLDGTALALAAHYLSTGEATGLRPSSAFDPRFYRSYHPDVAEHGISPLLHYLKFGQYERRYTTHAQLRADAEAVAKSGLFDTRIYARARRRQAMSGLNDIEDYLLNRDHQSSIGEGFESEYYCTLYPDARTAPVVPLLHFLNTGRAEHRIPSRRELERQRRELAESFDETHYLRQVPEGLGGATPLDHYILYGARKWLEPSAEFSPDYYLRRYTDIADAGLNPFQHYVLHGKTEGRLGRPDFRPMLSAGEREFDLSRPTVLVTCHEADRSGAPLVGLNVGMRLAASHNVIFYVGRQGPLLGAFREASCLVGVGHLSPLDSEYFVRWLRETHRLDMVVLNSVETSPFAAAALYADMPALALIHEFAEYTLPSGRMSRTVESVDCTVVPAGLIRDSIQAELGRTRLGPARHIVVQPQGYLPQLPPDDSGTDLSRDQILALTGCDAQEGVRFVLGAGFVHMRKGVDLFVQTAAEVRRLHGPGVRFIWVGNGYDPTRDLHYTAWVADMVRRLDLEDTVFFMPVQGSLDTLFTLADVFYLPSRLDPFPNVVLDALKAGLPVVCFERATGSAEMFQDGSGAVGAAVGYCSVGEAAEAVVRFFDPAEAWRARGNAEFAERQFSFSAYMEAISGHMTAARAERARITEAVRQLEATGLFDADFHEGVERVPGKPHPRQAIRDYVARGMKGLMLYSPRPGFNEGAARIACGQAPALGAAGAPPATHRCIVIDETRRRAPFAGQIALHLHLHYPELAAGLCADLVAAGCKADLIVTTTSEERRIEVAYALRGYKGGRVQVIVVANRGRDIGPFLTEVAPLVRDSGYDVVGHFHGKRSLAVDAAMGDRWRNFMIGTLLGGKAGLTGALAPFNDDPELGLLFPEDRHLVGWSANRDVAAVLASRMTPPPVLPAFPIFPLGTMFWARPDALGPLLSLGLTEADFPPEPVAYDGTVLHAIERLLPAVCEAAGYGWSTLYRRGASW